MKNKEGPKETKDNVVFVGTKPFLNYVTSVIIQFTAKKQDSVIIKARGKFISRAVDVAEIVKKRFLDEDRVEVKNVKIGSEEFQSKEGKTISVSIIEIELHKDKK